MSHLEQTQEQDMDHKSSFENSGQTASQVVVLLCVMAFISTVSLLALIFSGNGEATDDIGLKSNTSEARHIRDTRQTFSQSVIRQAPSPIQNAVIAESADQPVIQTIAGKPKKHVRNNTKPEAAVLAKTVKRVQVPQPAIATRPINLEKFRKGQFTVREAAEALDTAVNNGLAKAGQKPTVAITDSDFVRRIYLDTIGRIPNLDEYRAYMNATDDEYKRDALIKELVNRSTYASHQYNYWVGVLRARTRENNANGTNYLNYIRESLRTNKPYDKFVNEMLASSGSPHKEGNGAVGYYFRDTGMPLDNLSNTMQVFLGTDISCAQCHDDPFKEWSQLDYFQLAAFSSGMNYRSSGQSYRKNYQEARESLSFKKTQKDTQKKILVGRLNRLMNYGLSGGGTGLIRLPHDYAYDDAKPHDVVKARALFGQQPKLNVNPSSVQPLRASQKRRRNMPAPGKDINSREAFADWLTSKKNPMFTKAIVNRVWHKIMGSQLIGPLTDLDFEAMGSNPQLTKTLVAIMEGLDYDLKKFETVIFASDAYQRATVRQDLKADEQFLFNGPIMTRLTAEQVWDTVNLLKYDRYDLNYEMKPGQNQEGRLFASLEGKTPLEILMLIPEDLDNWRDFPRKYGKDQAFTDKANAHLEKMRPLEEAHQAKLAAEKRRAEEVRKAKYRRAQEAKRRAAARKAAQRKAAQRKAQEQKKKAKQKKAKEDEFAMGANSSMGGLISASPMVASEIEISVSALPKAKTQNEILATANRDERKSKKQPAAENVKTSKQTKSAWQSKKRRKSNKLASMMSGMSSIERRSISGRLQRSSEEASPARVGHFLREFGQGDRLLIDGNNTESSVPQALLLMNGLSESILLNPKSSLNQHVAVAEDKVLTAFEVILSRSPTREERARFAGWEARDVCWVLINSTEFLFRR